MIDELRQERERLLLRLAEINQSLSAQDGMCCLRCGHRWLRRITAKPIRCPKCMSAHWDTPRARPASP